MAVMCNLQARAASEILGFLPSCLVFHHDSLKVDWHVEIVLPAKVILQGMRLSASNLAYRSLSPYFVTAAYFEHVRPVQVVLKN